MSKIVFLGVEGSGKTTLTMALAKAFEQHRSEGWYLKPLSRDSFRFLKMLPKEISGEFFPSQTADLRELSWEIEYNGEVLTDFAILDYPGEIYRLAFLDEKDERDPASFRQKVTANKKEIDALLNAVKTVEYIYVLFNLQDAEGLSDNPCNLDAIWVTNACLHLLKKLESKPSIRLLLTQADRYRDAGRNLSLFKLDDIDLVGHDHPDIPWEFVSTIEDPASEYGIDKIIRRIVEKPLEPIVAVKRRIQQGNIGLGKLITELNYKLRMDKSVIDEVEKSISKAALLQNSGVWLGDMLSAGLGGKNQIADWQKIKEFLINLDGVECNKIDLSHKISGMKTEWGGALNENIYARICELRNQVEQSKTDNKIGAIVCIVIVLLFLLILAFVTTFG